MGTRGLLGFRLDGNDYLTYNHFDSYPAELGKKVVNFINGVVDWDEVKQKVHALRLVDELDTPTSEDITACHIHGVEAHNPNHDAKIDWYWLLHSIQGELKGYLTVGVMCDSHNFIYNSLFCEWAYIVNLDELKLEVYRGFQEEKHNMGRYADREAVKGYYPCALLGSYPFDDLPNMNELEKES